MRGYSIMVGEADAQRLRGLLATRQRSSARDSAHLEELRTELERALVLAAEELPAGVVAMDSRVRVLDLESGQRHEYELVYPADADPAAGRVSVLAPLGTALLGFREGDLVHWRMPGGLRRLQIERVHRPRCSSAPSVASMQ